MKKYFLFYCCLFFSISNSFAQTDTTIWESVKKVEENNYIISIPQGWKETLITANSGMEHKFELTGIGIVGTVQSAPMNAFFSISKVEGLDNKVALENVLQDFTVFYDRVTEAGANYDTASLAVKSGEVGTYLHTRYYRRSKVSNYSRYYLVVPYPKLNATFILSFLFQYKDATYDIERSGRFKSYAEKVFSTFLLR
jgi:hypothetical protein